MSTGSGEQIDIGFRDSALEILRQGAEAFGISEADVAAHSLTLFRHMMLPLQEEGTEVSFQVTRPPDPDSTPRNTVGRWLDGIINPPEVERYYVKRPGPTSQPAPPAGRPSLTLIVNHDYKE